MIYAQAVEFTKEEAKANTLSPCSQIHEASPHFTVGPTDHLSAANKITPSHEHILPQAVWRRIICEL